MLETDMVRVCDVQTEIIKMQSDIIDSLFMRLAQNIPAEELRGMPEIEKIDEVVTMRESIGEEVEGVRVL